MKLVMSSGILPLKVCSLIISITLLSHQKMNFTLVDLQHQVYLGINPNPPLG